MRGGMLRGPCRIQDGRRAPTCRIQVLPLPDSLSLSYPSCRPPLRPEKNHHPILRVCCTEQRSTRLLSVGSIVPAIFTSTERTFSIRFEYTLCRSPSFQFTYNS